MNKVPRWVFHYVGNKTFISPGKKRILCPRTTKFGPKLAFLSGLAGGCGARAVSRKTPIYFIFIMDMVQYMQGGTRRLRM